MKNYMKKFILLLICVLLAACARTYVEEDKSPLNLSSVPKLPKYTGQKTVVAVLPLGLSERAAKRYPHLLKKSVGLGIHNVTLDSLFDTGRFRFVEEKPEIIKDIMNRQWMGASGFVDQQKAVEYGKMLGAEKVIYGEVFDYAEGGESVSGFSGRQKYNIKTGIQLVCTDINTGEKVSLGTATATAKSYGDAMRLAIDKAVYTLVRRLQ